MDTGTNPAHNKRRGHKICSYTTTRFSVEADSVWQTQQSIQGLTIGNLCVVLQVPYDEGRCHNTPHHSQGVLQTHNGSNDHRQHLIRGKERWSFMNLFQAPGPLWLQRQQAASGHESSQSRRRSGQEGLKCSAEGSASLCSVLAGSGAHACIARQIA